ncbi:uncharacterized protein N7503_003940 [Penicillium pulvis]|uniref:uncharacterized protein n=1 Tax=Penicillium pulvis TaxID=1562058 RepID=UPI002546BF38|nr:uncharacterized protein N7503_003940 [Penicillium pulvis]KAJ5806338.1 hypothetical protein N7503_003940 [Penicillium pulvis]
MARTKKPQKLDKAFLPRPPLEALRAEKGVLKPDVFDDVQLGSYVSKTDAKIAYQAWSLPDRALGKAWHRHKNRPYTQPETDDPEAHILVHNVYEHLMSEPLLPISREDAEIKFKADGLEKDWEVSGIIGQLRGDIIKESVLSNLKSWGSDAIKEFLVERDVVSSNGERQHLEKLAERTELLTYCGITPRSNLKKWGLKMNIRPLVGSPEGGVDSKHVIQPFENDFMSTLDMYTFAIHLSPYNPTYWTSRAYCHYQLAYFDLALGDAYRAKILCDVLTNGDESGRRPGLYPRIWHAIEQHLLVEPQKEGTLKPEIRRLRERGCTYFISGLAKALEHITTLSLLALNCWHDLDKRYNSFGSNMIMVQDRDSLVPQQLRGLIAPIEKIRTEENKDNKTLFWHERFQGYISTKRRYPHDMYVDRKAQKFLDTINLNVFQRDGKHWNSCRVEGKKDNSLGVFAAVNIMKGEMIHFEEPTIRGHLGPKRMARDKTAVQDEIRCENCMQTISVFGSATRSQASTETRFERCACCPAGTAPGPDDRVFCKEQAKAKAKGTFASQSCREIARKLHHFSSCGKDWSWLYNSMRPVLREWQDREYIIQCNDVYGTMHSLLLRNIFEITLQRRKKDPNLSPLEINELLILNTNNGDWYPFSYVGNITVPFDILTYLGVDIFRDLSFDTWVIQSIMRRLVDHAIPWDEQRRGDEPRPELLPGDSYKSPEHPDTQDEKVQQKISFKLHDPSFMNLYLFPGFSLFKRDKTYNANWGYDDKVPNRLVVWAENDIKKGEEIIIRDPYCSDRPTGGKGTEPEKMSVKRKRDEYAEVDDFRVSIYRNTDMNPPPGTQRRKARKHGFRPHVDKRHQQWLEHLEEMDEKADENETSAEKKARVKRLKKVHLVAYRKEQRETIDELDRRAGRPRRKRDAAFE